MSESFSVADVTAWWVSTIGVDPSMTFPPDICNKKKVAEYPNPRIFNPKLQPGTSQPKTFLP